MIIYQINKNIIDKKSIFLFVINESIFDIKEKYDVEDFKLSFSNLYFANGFTEEFNTKLKETIKLKFKPVLDAGKTINFYELKDLGDNPCLLKKI